MLNEGKKMKKNKGNKGNKGNFLETNEPSYIELQNLATKHGVSIENLFANEKFDDEVVDILYPYLKLPIRMLTSKNIFKKGYVLKREDFIRQFKSIDKQFN